MKHMMMSFSIVKNQIFFFDFMVVFNINLNLSDC